MFSANHGAEKDRGVTLRPLPNGLRWAETASEEAGFETKSGAVPIRWAWDQGIIDVIADEMVVARQKKEEGLAKLAEWRAMNLPPPSGKPPGRPKGSKNKPKRETK